MTHWGLLRIWHCEVLASVADHPTGARFDRESYCVAPNTMRALPLAELQRRIEMILDRSYERRNYFVATPEDRAEMWWIGYAWEWVAPTTMPAEEVAPDNCWVRLTLPFHDNLICGTIDALEDQWLVARAGIDARPWKRAFSQFAIDGDSWKILKRLPESDALFEERLLSSTSARDRSHC